MLKQLTATLTALAFAATASAGISCISLSDADDTYGPVEGNDAGAKDLALPLLNDDDVFGDIDWTNAGKSDDSGNGPFTSNPGGTTGTLTFDSPQSGPFVISLKGSRQFTLYYFADAVDVDCIDFTMIDKAGLSHASLFVAGGTPPTGIPSPTAALAGLGLLGFIGARRRRG